MVKRRYDLAETNNFAGREAWGGYQFFSSSNNAFTGMGNAGQQVKASAIHDASGL
jgi:hypothetical protein